MQGQKGEEVQSTKFIQNYGEMALELFECPKQECNVARAKGYKCEIAQRQQDTIVKGCKGKGYQGARVKRAMAQRQKSARIQAHKGKIPSLPALVIALIDSVYILLVCDQK